MHVRSPLDGTFKLHNVMCFVHVPDCLHYQVCVCPALDLCLEFLLSVCGCLGKSLCVDIHAQYVIVGRFVSIIFSY